MPLLHLHLVISFPLKLHDTYLFSETQPPAWLANNSYFRHANTNFTHTIHLHFLSIIHFLVGPQQLYVLQPNYFMIVIIVKQRYILSSLGSIELDSHLCLTSTPSHYLMLALLVRLFQPFFISESLSTTYIRTTHRFPLQILHSLCFSSH